MHALPCAGTQTLLDVAGALTCVPSLAVLVDLLHRDAPPASPHSVLALHDARGAALLGGALAANADERGLRVVTDPEPGEVLRALADQAGMDVVVACHGEFNPDRPAASVLRLGGQRELSLADLTSGVSLARCRSVIFAACESGMVRSGIGSEYLGLPGVLLAAGVPTAVGSLWRVNQLATSLLLDFYLDDLSRAQPIAAALASAQRRLRDLRLDEVQLWVDARLASQAPLLQPLVETMPESPFEHPDFWAGFYVAGV
jgi:hypothetical protein